MGIKNGSHFPRLNYNSEFSNTFSFFELSFCFLNYSPTYKLIFLQPKLQSLPPPFTTQFQYTFLFITQSNNTHRLATSNIRWVITQWIVSN